MGSYRSIPRNVPTPRSILSARRAASVGGDRNAPAPTTQRSTIVALNTGANAPSQYRTPVTSPEISRVGRTVQTAAAAGQTVDTTSAPPGPGGPPSATVATGQPTISPLAGAADSELPALGDVVDDATSDIPTSDAPDGIDGLEGTSTLRDLTEAELALLLDGIAARYGLTREQLLAQESQLGLVAQQIATQARRGREQAVQGAQRGALERGILRSGLYGQEVAAIDTATNAALQEAALQRQQAQSAIDQQQAAIEGQVASEQAAARQQAEQGMLQFEQGQTVADLLAGLPPPQVAPPGPLVPGAPLTPSPLIPPAPGLAQVAGQYANTSYPATTPAPMTGLSTDAAKEGLKDTAAYQQDLFNRAITGYGYIPLPIGGLSDYGFNQTDPNKTTPPPPSLLNTQPYLPRRY